jgi:HEPN domain-containing protein
MNRLVFQELAEERLRDAAALLQAGQWSGAYYLAGYAVECGLKACIARLTNQDDYPNKELALKCYTHKIDVLVEVAQLTLQRVADAVANPTFGANWLIIRNWDEKARYEQWREADAKQLFSAVNDAANGVLPWIKARW